MTKTTLQSHKATNHHTDVELFESDEDSVVIRWDGEQKIIETYTSGTTDPLYVGPSLEAARESLQLTNGEWDTLLATDVQYLERS